MKMPPKETFLILFVFGVGSIIIATFLSVVLSIELGSEADGTWVVDASFNGRQMDALPIKQWHISGEKLSTTIDFDKDISKIGFKNWPKKPISIIFKDSLVEVIGSKGTRISFNKKYRDFSIFNMEGYVLISDKLEITLMRNIKK